MARLYTVTFDRQTITSAGGDRDFFYLAPADDKPIKIIGWEFAQFSDLGDAQEESIAINIVRGHTTAGSGGPGAATPAPVDPIDAAAGFTARTNDTTIASGGTATTLYCGGHNLRVAPAPYFLPELLRFPCSQVEGSIVLRMMSTLADDVTMSGTLWVLEGL